MDVSPGGDRVPDRSTARFGDSVFRSQVLLAGAVAFAVCLTVGLPRAEPLANSASFFVGLSAILWITVIAALVPWLRYPVTWQAAVPLLDIVAIALLRFAEPQSGFGVLMIFPVIWLATSFGVIGAIAGATTAGVLLWGQIALAELGLLGPSGITTSPAVTASLSIALAFVAGVTHMTARRVHSQRVLLRRQTRMLEQALGRARIQESTVREALDAVEFAVISLDLSGNILTMNRATRALLAELGLPENTPWNRFPLYRSDRLTPLAPDDMPNVRVLAGHRVDDETYWIGHRTSTRFTIDVRARVLRDADGTADRVVLVLRDVSAEVRAIADRDDLVTSMSHELRTPLSSILGYVDLALETEGLPDETKAMLEIALTNTQRLNALVNDLLSARSTSPANGISLTFADCDVTMLVTESVEAIRVVAAERLIPITLETDDSVHAEADAFRLRQVIDNLLSNAIKYNRIGGRITASVRAVSAEEGPLVEIRIADTGRGMTLEEQKGLFERFYRAESVRGSTVHGTGLGLNISREIIVKHGGTIEVSSEPDHGTEVTVTLPRHRPDTPSIEES